MQSTFSAAADDRTSAEHTASRLVSNAYRWFTVADHATEAEAASYVADLQALGLEAYADHHQPPPTTNHGYRTLRPEERKALADRQRADNPDSPVVLSGTAKTIPSEVYGPYVFQEPARIRVLARWTGTGNSDAAAPDLRGRRLAAGRK